MNYERTNLGYRACTLRVAFTDKALSIDLRLGFRKHHWWNDGPENPIRRPRFLELKVGLSQRAFRRGPEGRRWPEQRPRVVLPSDTRAGTRAGSVMERQ